MLFIQTGGTIDKDYPKKDKGYAFEIAEPAADRILKQIGLDIPYEVVSLFKKDSQEITDADRSELKLYLQSRTEKKIIITHGTDTLIRTAKFIGEIPNKVLVFTGAFLPERFKDSDAAFNLGAAIGVASIKEEGTFIAMNGMVSIPENCEKHPLTGKFISLKEELE